MRTHHPKNVTDPASLPDPSRKARGAFFTPEAIADYLAVWAVGDDATATVLDPTCGEAVFVLAAGRRLRQLGMARDDLRSRVFGVDLHGQSLQEAEKRLRGEDLDATLIEGDFFNVPTPAQLGSPVPPVDAIIGNPPFVRYQQHIGETRKRALAAALAQGVQLSGLASSWAALLVHASGFLKPEGRLAIVLPAELLTVGYAEPVRRWLRRRFAAVHLVMFERLQFADALEKVVLLIARGSGGCDAFSLYLVEDAAELANLHPFDHVTVAPADEGKWTDALLPVAERQLFRRVAGESFVPLAEYGSPELGTVTGANGYFALTEQTRTEYGLRLDQLRKIAPPGTKYLRGLTFTQEDWERLRDARYAVWLLYPEVGDRSTGLRAYVRHGEELGVPNAYKCRIRIPWWRPPVVSPPDLFFTYMSHRYPRLVANLAGVTFLNSMHGLRLGADVPPASGRALPLLAMNSLTMLGAEIHGRSYGGGILKMEPKEAAQLPVPNSQLLVAAWERLSPEVAELEVLLRQGEWASAVRRVDHALLHETIGLTVEEIAALASSIATLRGRRLGR